MNNAKKSREKIEWESLETSSRKSEIPRNISCKDWLNKGQKWYGPNRSRRYSEKMERIHKKLYKTDLHDPDNHDGVITHLEPESWNVKSSGP